MHVGIIYALLSAALFGASTPMAKILIGQVAPATLAGLLYLGSGLGLGLWLLVRPKNAQGAGGAGLTRPDLPWLAGAIVAGGIGGPLLLMTGLAVTPASAASLLLNMEGVLTAALAWFVFRENFDRRIFVGMLLIVAAGLLLSWNERPTAGVPWGALSIVASCLCWAIDNNLTRKVSASDAVQIAAVKGLVAGSVNLVLAMSLGNGFPPLDTIAVAGVTGLCGYGVSLVMFVLALRHLGTARTGAYFSAAPFFGAALSLLVLGDRPTAMFWLAAALMAAGLWLHLTETHVHEHEHGAMEHSHMHKHDTHHRHAHDFNWEGTEPHAHRHRHQLMRHSHPHYPDIHHRHEH